MVGEAGIEPTTPGLEGRCSIRLSYSPGFLHCSFEAAIRGIVCAQDRVRQRHANADASVARASVPCRSAGGEIGGDSEVRPVRRDEGAANNQIGTAAAQADIVADEHKLPGTRQQPATGRAIAGRFAAAGRCSRRSRIRLPRPAHPVHRDQNCPVARRRISMSRPARMRH